MKEAEVKLTCNLLALNTRTSAGSNSLQQGVDVVLDQGTFFTPHIDHNLVDKLRFKSVDDNIFGGDSTNFRVFRAVEEDGEDMMANSLRIPFCQIF